MAPGVPLTGSLILLALFVAPGLLAIKVGHHFSRATDRTDRLDATVASLLTSAASLTALYVLVSFSLGGYPTLTELESALSIPLFIHGYASLVSIAILLGMYYGLYQHHIVNSNFSFTEMKAVRSCSDLVSAVEPAMRGDERSTRQEVWDYVFDRIYSESEVKIHLREDDSVLQGEILVWGDSPKRDLLLSPGTRRELEEGDSPSVTYRYIPHQDIAHIQFNEDLNENDRDVVEREIGDKPDHPNPEVTRSVGQKIAEQEVEERGLSNQEELFEQVGVDDVVEFGSKLIDDEEFRQSLEVDGEFEVVDG